MGLEIDRTQIAALSVDDRLKLVDLIWDTIEADWVAHDLDSSHELPQTLKDELDRRIEAHEANPNAGSTWEEVKARLTTRLGGKP